MTVDDIDAVVGIENKNFAEPWSEVGFLTHLMREDALYLVAECYLKDIIVPGVKARQEEMPDESIEAPRENEPIGICGYIGILMVPDEGDITKVSVSGNMRNMGIGDMLIKELVKRAYGRGIRNVYLEVSEKNDSALHLYRKNGFEEIGRRKNYYASLGEDALNMVLHIEHIR